MALPININNLIHGKIIESERIEFKANWNPKPILHTMCAFANDMHNWGGGYIIVGIEEEGGIPKLPPKGIERNKIDGYLKELVSLGHRLLPNYHPITETYDYEGKLILIIWCPAGDNRPYSAPITIDKKEKSRTEFIRISSVTKQANQEEKVKLFELAQRIPFDDRINHTASIDDLDLGLIREYLKEVGSDLYSTSSKMSMDRIALSMLIGKKYGEEIKPLNVGLLFFSEAPERFFPKCGIEVIFHHDYGTKQFEERIFSGPIHHQLRNALAYIKTLVIRERIIKLRDKAEADRDYNYPYAAIEEALANAVYHKSYEKHSPIEVHIWPNRIEIISYPGPVPPVTKKVLSKLPENKRIIAREYRNRRVGDLLKELNLTEGRGTGIPTIYETLEKNGSPKPIFETDDDLNYFITTIFCREDMIAMENDWTNSEHKGRNSEHKSGNSEHKGGNSEHKSGNSEHKSRNSEHKGGNSEHKSGNSEHKEEEHNITDELRPTLEKLGKRATKVDMRLAILSICANRFVSLANISAYTKRSEGHLRQRHINELISEGLLIKQFEEANHPNQAYRTTGKGIKLIKERIDAI